MSVTKSSITSDISTAIDNAVTNSGNLTDGEQATVMQAVYNYIQTHCDTINPNVHQTPSIKFKT